MIGDTVAGETWQFLDSKYITLVPDERVSAVRLGEEQSLQTVLYIFMFNAIAAKRRNGHLM